MNENRRIKMQVVELALAGLGQGEAQKGGAQAQQQLAMVLPLLVFYAILAFYVSTCKIPGKVKPSRAAAALEVCFMGFPLGRGRAQHNKAVLVRLCNRVRLQ